MIKSTELRIGNYLKEYYSEKVIKVDIGTLTIISAIEKNKDFQQTLCAIPLTEAWHIKFGAKKVGSKFSYTFRGAEFIVNYDKVRENWWVEYKNGSLISPLPIIIHHVHQLQNFWFGNTGEELTL